MMTSEGDLALHVLQIGVSDRCIASSQQLALHRVRDIKVMDCWTHRPNGNIRAYPYGGIRRDDCPHLGLELPSLNVAHAPQRAAFTIV